MARILVVDDVQFISKILASFFQDRGHDVAVAVDGEQAFAHATRELPDLVLTDISMPRIDGLELARRLKRDPRTAVIPIMVVTARNDSEALNEAREAGVDEYVLKPFDAKRLLKKATELLGGYPMNYSLSEHGTVRVLTALSPDLAGEAVVHLPGAMRASMRESEPLVLDLSRVRKVETTAAPQVLAVLEELRVRHVNAHVVPPPPGLGSRAFTSRLIGQVSLHDDLAAAIEALGEDPSARVRPVRFGGRAPSSTRAAG